MCIQLKTNCKHSEPTPEPPLAQHKREHHACLAFQRESTLATFKLKCDVKCNNVTVNECSTFRKVSWPVQNVNITHSTNSHVWQVYVPRFTVLTTKHTRVSQRESNPNVANPCTRICQLGILWRHGKHVYSAHTMYSMLWRQTKFMFVNQPVADTNH